MKTRLAILLGIVAVLFFVTPPEIPVCGFRWLTGRPCPLCGLTRALFALGKGDFRAAIHFHALSPLAAVMLIALVWDRSRWTRYWAPCALAFGVYGAWRIAAAG
jgi:hypothetical protein